MSLMDDPNEIELAGAIQSARICVDKLYMDADYSRQRIIDSIWDLYRKKTGVPNGTSTSVAWGIFRQSIEEISATDEKNTFDISEPYHILKQQRDRYKLKYQDVQGLNSDLLAESLARKDMIQFLSQELLRISKTYPGVQFSKGVEEAIKENLLKI